MQATPGHFSFSTHSEIKTCSNLQPKLTSDIVNTREKSFMSKIDRVPFADMYHYFFICKLFNVWFSLYILYIYIYSVYFKKLCVYK